MSSAFVCCTVRSPDSPGMSLIREMFTEYQGVLLDIGCDISVFQGFDDELAGLPGKYDAKAGGILLVCIEQDPSAVDTPSAAIPVVEESECSALAGGILPSSERVAACVALRKLDDSKGEIKRLYVRPSFRRRGLGKRLSELITSIAVDTGYSQVFLDTLERLPAAIAMYTSLGFSRTSAYCYNPLEDAVYMTRDMKQDIAPTTAITASPPASGTTPGSSETVVDGENSKED